MEKIQLEVLGLSSSQAQVGSFALVLGEKNGNRRLPIIIGGFEAQAIALEIESIKPNRPLTHDLFVTVARSFDIGLKEVVINDLKEGVFFSTMLLFIDDDWQEIDARPSDAIAIAVRFKAPIYVNESILQEAGIVVRETESREPEPVEKRAYEDERESESQGKAPATREQKVKSLTERIERAIDREDYEEAARLRDEISKL